MSAPSAQVLLQYLIYSHMLARRLWCRLRASARYLETPASKLSSTAIEASDELKAQVFLSLIRKRGHLVAYLDPLRRGNGGPWKGFGEHQSGSRRAPSQVVLTVQADNTPGHTTWN